MSQTKRPFDIIRQAMIYYRGDDLQRAEAAFRNFTPAQMAEQHGYSGKTRQQVLDEYRQWDLEWRLAMNIIEARIPEVKR